MKAVVCRQLGPPSLLRLEDLPDPDLKPHQARVRLRAAAVNFPDILMVAGGYQHKPPLPFVPGFEAAGEVVECGAAVETAKPGDRVIVHLRTGGYADRAVVDADSLLPMPANYGFEEGAAFLVGYSTAYVSLVRRGRLAAGEVLLVHGAAGGVGLAAVELGKHLGARVIAVVSNAEKAAAARAAGADHTIDPASGRLRDAVRDLTDGRGADVIYDPVGGDAFDESLRCVAWAGRLLVVGFASGRIPVLPANLALLKGCSVSGVRAVEFARRDPERGAENQRALLRLAEAGALRPRIYRTLPLADFEAAMALVSERQVIGKVVLTPE